MGVFRSIENGVENAFDKASGAVFKSPLEPAQIAKKAVQLMRQNKLVGSGRQYAPTLYNVLVSPKDNNRLFGFYPTLAAEIETLLMSKGADSGLIFDGRPLVRFIVDNKLKSGRFDIIVEVVAGPVLEKLREEEMEYYGIDVQPKAAPAAAAPAAAAGGAYAAAAAPKPNSYRFDYDNSEYYDLDEPDELGTAAPPPADDSRLTGNFKIPEPQNMPSLGSAALVVQGSGAVHPLTTRQMSAGRDLGNQIVLADAGASRKHACFEQNAAGTWKLVDMGSTNGTLLNDRPVTTSILRNGDLITIGTTVLEFTE